MYVVEVNEVSSQNFWLNERSTLKEWKWRSLVGDKRGSGRDGRHNGPLISSSCECMEPAGLRIKLSTAPSSRHRSTQAMCAVRINTRAGTRVGRPGWGGIGTQNDRLRGDHTAFVAGLDRWDESRDNA